MKEKLPLILLILIVSVIIASELLYFSPKFINSLTGDAGSSDQSNNGAITSPPKPDEQSIAIVGKEIIYEQDLNHELALSPASTTKNNNQVKEYLVRKLISDSVALQAGQADGIIALDASVFNSKQKDYPKRLALLNKIQQHINQQATGNISGTLVAVWFNNNWIGPLGYEKSKEMAFTKISLLRSNVLSGKMTIAEAAAAISSDSSLSQIDLAYKNNAVMAFKASKGEEISFDAAVDTILWQTKSGQVTPLIVAKDPGEEDQTRQEVAYMFALIDSNNTDTNAFSSFNDWLEKQKKQYDVTLY